MINTVLSQAQHVVAEVNNTISSSHQNANRLTELPYCPTLQTYESHLSRITPEQQIRHLHTQTKLEKIREAVVRAVTDLGPNYTNPLIMHAAVSKLTNLGECGEMSTYAAIKCAKFSTTFFVSLIKGVHSFLILAEPDAAATITEYALNKGSVFQLIQSLQPNAVIVDPFLRFACFAKDFQKDGIDLIKYVDEYGANNVGFFEGFLKDSPGIKHLSDSAAKVSEIASEILKKMAFDSTDSKILAKLLDESCAILKNSGISKSSLKWKWSLAKEDAPLIFCICKKAESEEIKAALQKLKVSCQVNKIVNKDEYCILVRDVHPQVLKAKLQEKPVVDSRSESDHRVELLTEQLQETYFSEPEKKIPKR